MSVNFSNLSEMSKSALREITNIGMGNAATSMTNLLGKSVDISIPKVSAKSFSEAQYTLGEPEEEVIAVMARISNDIEGVILFILKIDFASDMTESMMGLKLSSYAEIDEMSFSAIIECGNIVISSYLKALGEMTGFDIKLSVPDGTINMLGGVMNVPMVEVGYETDKLLMVTGEFIVGDTHHEGCLLMVPTVESLNKLLRKLGIDSE